MPTLCIGTIVRSARERQGLTREALARRAEVSTSMVTRLELQNKIPNADAMYRMAALLGIDQQLVAAAIYSAVEMQRLAEARKKLITPDIHLAS